MLDFRAVLESFSDAVVAADRSGCIVYFNRAAETLLGWNRSELIGEPLTLLIPERLRESHRVAFARFSESPGRPGQPFKVPARRKDGEEVPVELNVSSLGSGEDILVLGVIRALGARVDLEQKVLARQRVLAQYELMKVLTESRSLSEAAPRILQAIGESLGWGVGLLWMPDGSSALAPVALWASSPQRAAGFVEASRGLCFRHGEGLVGKVWQEARPLWSVDVTRDQRYRRAAAAAESGLRCAMFFPVAGADRALGVLEFLSPEPREPDEELQRVMAAMGFQLGQFIERLSAEEKLRESQEWLSTTLRSIGDAVIATDTRGKVAFFNAAAEALTGWRKEEAEAQPLGRVFRIIDEKSHTPVEDPATRIVRSHTAMNPFNQVLLVARDGTERTIEESGSPILSADGQLRGLVVVFRDASERRRAAEAMRYLARAGAILGGCLDFEATLRNVAALAVPGLADWCWIHLVEGAAAALRPVAVAHSDPAKLRAAEELTRRYPPVAGAPHGAAKVVRTGEPELIPEVTGELLAAYARDPEHLRLLKEAGFGSAMIIPLMARGKAFGAINLVASGRRRYTEADLSLGLELASRAAQAVENARLYQETQEAVRVRDDFLTIAGHELRTPLTPLSLQLESLRRACDRLETASLPHRFVPRLEAMGRQVARMERLVNNLLEISRITSGRLTLEREEVDLREVVREVVSYFRDDLERADSPLLVTAPGEVRGKWDRLRLEQAVTNLVSNAVKFGAGQPIEVGLAQEGGTARLTVRDRGIGIAPEDQARIFERFERAVPGHHYGGLGLGLWVVRQIVEALGGSIQVQSQLGSGSTFTLELPVEPPLPPPASGSGSG